MGAWDSIDSADYQEIRFAVVMNGGVSLAIWMGGVARELNRLTESNPAAGGCYGDLLNLVKSRPRIDVLAGTSAGGINAGFLALAAVYRTDLSAVGRLWAEAGSLMELMRSPLDSWTPSLLKGDSYFLPQLQGAFRGLVGQSAPIRLPDEQPVHLTITTSLMDGQVKEFIDDFGTRIQQTQHRGAFKFVRGPEAVSDPFADPKVADQLALAARSTASFPLAFEASFVPVDSSPPADRVSMPKSHTNFDRSRYVLDGGVLMNMPMEPAIRAIFEQPAETEVRRVLTYINPHPATLAEADAASYDDPPQLTQVLGAALISLPSAQSISRELEDLQANNVRARARKSLRPELLKALGDKCDEMSHSLFATYRNTRLVKAARNIGIEALIGHSLAGPAVQDPDVAPWTATEISRAIEDYRREPSPPFVPNRRNFDSEEQWDWGLAPVERLAIVALDVLKRALFVAPFSGLQATAGSASAEQVRAGLREGRRLVHGYLADIRAMRKEDSAFWRTRVPLPTPASNETQNRREALAGWAAHAIRTQIKYLASPSDHAYSFEALQATVLGIVEVLTDRIGLLRDAAEAGGRSDNPDVEQAARDLDDMLDTLLGTGSGRRIPDTAEAIVQRLLYVEICFMSLAGGAPQEQDVELMQISGDAQHSFGGPARADQKLAGVQMHHFGAFYKKSWRVNDWIWGRMDGALRLVEATLGPRRLRQLALRLDPQQPYHTAIKDLLRTTAVGDGGDSEYLSREFEKDWPAIANELAFLDDPLLPTPASLPVTARAIARRLYVEILDEELEGLADAVEHDNSNGADTTSKGTSFARSFKRESDGAGLSGERKCLLFANSGIGQERILGEKGTDLFAATTSRTAAVMTSVASGPKIPAVRAIFRPIRGLVLLLYALVYGSVVGSKFGAWAVNAVLAAGGAMIAITLLSAGDVPQLVTFAGLAVLLAGLALAALRSGMLIVMVVLGVVAAGIGIWAIPRPEVLDHLKNAFPEFLTVAGLVIGFGLLGLIRNPKQARRPDR